MKVPLKWWHHSPSTNSKVKTSLTRVYMNATFKLYLTEILKKPIPRLKLNFKFAWFGCCMHPPALSSSSWCIRTLRFPLFSCIDAVGTKIDWKRYIYYYYHYNFFSFSNNDPPPPQRPNFISLLPWVSWKIWEHKAALLLSYTRDAHQYHTSIVIFRLACHGIEQNLSNAWIFPIESYSRMRFLFRFFALQLLYF